MLSTYNLHVVSQIPILFQGFEIHVGGTFHKMNEQQSQGQWPVWPQEENQVKSEVRLQSLKENLSSFKADLTINKDGMFSLFWSFNIQIYFEKIYQNIMYFFMCFSILVALYATIYYKGCFKPRYSQIYKQT